MSKQPPFGNKAPKHAVESRGDFNSFGLEDLAYVKAVQIDGQKLYAIHAADGTPLTVIANCSLAFATVRQYEMEPLSVH
jgi:hypothetical protein